MPTPPIFDPGSDAPGILAAIVESSDDAIIGKDLDGHIVSWNAGAQRMYGYTAAEVVGRSIAILIPPEQPDELAAILRKVAAGERVAHYETVRVTKDGRRIDVSLTVSPIHEPAGGIVGCSVIARDVSGRKQIERELRASEARWRAIIESAVDGIVVIDARGRVEAFNAAAERLLGYAESEVLGHNVSMLMPSPYHEEHDGYLARYLATGEERIIGIGREVTGLRKDGTTFPVHLSVGRLSIDGETKFTGILHDLTARVRMEAQLREQSALTRLGEMAAVVAHEVKNPLTGIRGAIQVIGGRLPAGSKDATIAKEIIARIDALNDLMKELLLFARPPKPRLAAVEIMALLNLVVDLVRQDPALRDLHIDVVGSPRTIDADAELLKIVVQNLVLNGAHAMQASGRIVVAVTDADGACEIAVADAGPGIPLEVREKLFTPFFTTKARGTGLGLSTAKGFVEAHGGSISVECPPPGGTIVTIRLPPA